MKNYRFWIKTSLVFQLLNGLAHSISFFAQPAPANETESHLNELMRTYKMDDGFGFHPSVNDLFICLGISFILLYWLGALINYVLLKQDVINSNYRKSVLGVMTIIFALNFFGTVAFGFIAPVIFTGLVFLSQVIAYLLYKNEYSV